MDKSVSQQQPPEEHGTDTSVSPSASDTVADEANSQSTGHVASRIIKRPHNTTLAEPVAKLAKQQEEPEQEEPVAGCSHQSDDLPECYNFLPDCTK